MPFRRDQLYRLRLNELAALESVVLTLYFESDVLMVMKEIIFTYMSIEQCFCVPLISDVEGAVSWVVALESLGASLPASVLVKWGLTVTAI